MGIADHDEDIERQSGDAATGEDVELLPLYHETQPTGPFDTPLPDAKATPAEIRDYIFQLLRHRGLPPDQASTLAARWSNGTGRELRSYPIGMYAKIFGSDEDVWAVYMAIKTEHYKEDKYKAIPRKRRFLASLILFLVCIGEVALFWIPNHSDTLSVVFAVMTLITAVTALAIFMEACFNTQPEDKAEWELKMHYSQLPKPANQAS